MTCPTCVPRCQALSKGKRRFSIGLFSAEARNRVRPKAWKKCLKKMCDHSIGDAALGIQWHVIGMYAPSFFTGALIARLGLRTVMAAGLTLIIAAAVVGFMGVALWNFWISLLLLGVGWNFGFISATTLVTECCGPRERNKVQAFNDFLIFGSMAVASFASGALLTRYGWTAVTEVVFPVIIAAAALLAWGTFARRPNPV